MLHGSAMGMIVEGLLGKRNVALVSKEVKSDRNKEKKEGTLNGHSLNKERSGASQGLSLVRFLLLDQCKHRATSRCGDGGILHPFY